MNLTDARLLICKFHFDETVMAIQFENDKLHFLSLCDFSLAPGEIKELHVNFLSNLQILPEIESDLNENLAIAPDVSYNPQLCLPKISIANCADQQMDIPASTVLFSFTFPAPQIMGIFRQVDDIMSDFALDRNVLNFHFIKSTADCISKLGTAAYVRDLTSFKARTTRQAKKNMVKKPSAPPLAPAPPEDDDIFQLEGRSQNVVLQAMTLLNCLLKKNFSCSPRDMKELQMSDLKLRDLYLQAQYKSRINNKCIIINQILFKATKFNPIFFVYLNSY